MAQPQHHDQTGQPPKPAPRAGARPYEVRIDGARHGAFRDVRDAISAARIKKRELPHAMIGVTDLSTGQFLFEVDY